MANTVYVYSGSFNPLHAGHLSIAHYVERNFNCEVVFEICGQPYDKPLLSSHDVNKRVSQFHLLDRQVVVTDAASFVAKCGERFAIAKAAKMEHPGDCSLTFCVGHDTIERVGDKRYYFGSEEEVERCIELMSNTCKFLVFPRHGKLRENIRPSLVPLCHFVEDFAESPLSSTEIRNAETDKEGF